TQVEGQVMPDDERATVKYPVIEQAHERLAGQADQLMLNCIALDEGDLLAGEGVGVVEDAGLVQPVERPAGEAFGAVARDALIAVEAMDLVAAKAQAQRCVFGGLAVKAKTPALIGRSQRLDRLSFRAQRRRAERGVETTPRSSCCPRRR